MKYARHRLPPGEVEDLVQNTLTEALIATNAPSEEADFRRWLHGIARHKIADSYRRRGRQPVPSPDVDQRAAEASPSTGELSQWIESELPKTDGAQATLHWLLREGDGESLDEIARDLDLPAPRVRQRVSRLRRHLHARWLALGAAGLLLLVGAGALFQRASQPPLPPSIAREPVTPFERARLLRQNGLQRCAVGAYQECIAALDQAKALDPNGESAIAVVEARAAASHAEPSRVLPRAPTGTPPATLPDGKNTPKQYAPRKPDPKRSAPSKVMQKAEPLGAMQKQNVLPSKPAPTADDGALGGELSPKAQKRK